MLQTLTVAAVLGAAGPVPVPPAAPPPRATPVVTASYHLRNVGAADAAVAIGRALGIDREIRSRPVENQIVVQGSPATHARVVALVGELDREVPQVHVAATVAQVPLAFLADTGLVPLGRAELGGTCTLTAREAALLQTVLRHYPKREILSRPELLVRDNQTVYVRVGQDAVAPTPVPAGAVIPVVDSPTGLSARVTPRIAPDGKVLLRVETEVRSAVAPAAVGVVRGLPVNVATILATALVPAGDVVFVAIPITGDDGKPAAVLVVLTPSLVRTER